MKSRILPRCAGRPRCPSPQWILSPVVRTAGLLLAIAFVAAPLAGPARAVDPAAHLLATDGIGVADGPRQPCGELLLNGDLSFENGIGWQYAGVVPPYYGAFAEKYSGEYEVCGLTLFFTSLSGNQQGQTFDAYVWNNDSGIPGEVLCLTTDLDPGPVSIWPNVSRHEILLGAGCCVDGDWWCGWWGNWPGALCGWFQAEHHYDIGPQGFPYTNIAPGIGYPTGWHDVAVVWGPHWALGIGANVLECPPIPVDASTWGRIKESMRR